MPTTPAVLDLSGKTALVSGAASGIGAACVDRLAAAGAKVLAVDRDEAGLGRFEGVPEVERLTVDLSDLDAVDALPGEVDVLVNNAGIQHVSPVHEFPTEKWDLIIRLMLTSPFRLTRRVLPHMYAQGWGRVVNISSVHGLRASEFKAAYVSAKHGLEGFSKVVALEGGPHGVTSNCVNPAYVRTPLVEKQIADQARTHGIPESEVVEKIMLAPVAVKRLVEPPEVAELVAFLCSPAADSVSGTSFAMDGAWTAH
ncbi:MAG TPA: 3-hydroxybutyrate dehydrogenase [Pedococcus sp.]